MIEARTSEIVWVCPTRDNASAGTAGIVNMAPGVPAAVTFAGGMVAGDWLADTTAGGVSCLATARSSGKYLAVGSSHGLGLAYPWWFSCWVYHTTSVVDPHTILRSANRLYTGIGQASGVDRIQIYTGTWSSYTGGSAPALALNTWNHVAIQIFSGTMSWAYLNGVLAGSVAYGNTLSNSDAIHLMGRSDYATGTLGGRFDDFRAGSGILGTDAISWLAVRPGRHVVHHALRGGM